VSFTQASAGQQMSHVCPVWGRWLELVGERFSLGRMRYKYGAKEAWDLCHEWNSSEECYQASVNVQMCPVIDAACPDFSRAQLDCANIQLQSPLQTPTRHYCNCGEQSSAEECLALLPNAKMHTQPNDVSFELDEFSTSEWTFVAVSNKYGVHEEGELREGEELYRSPLTSSNFGGGGRRGGDTFAIHNARVKSGVPNPYLGLNLPLAASDKTPFFKV
jgi:hypothetical protein